MADWVKVMIQLYVAYRKHTLVSDTNWLKVKDGKRYTMQSNKKLEWVY